MGIGVIEDADYEYHSENHKKFCFNGLSEFLLVSKTTNPYRQIRTWWVKIEGIFKISGVDIVEVSQHPSSFATQYLQLASDRQERNRQTDRQP